MVPADLSRGAAFAIGQRSHSGKAEDDMRTVHLDRRENLVHHAQDIVNLLVADDRVIGIIDTNIGSADHHTPQVGQDQHDASVVVLEEDFAITRGCQQTGMIQHQVRPFGAADKTPFVPSQAPIDKIDPGSRGINYDFGLDDKGLAR